MRAVKNNLPTPSGEVGESESPRSMHAVEGSLGHSPRWRYKELADPRSDFSASQGEESVLADSGREGEITAGVGRVRSLAFLSILHAVLLLS